MNLGRVGIWSIELRLADPGEISERAAELGELGFGALWIPVPPAERILAALNPKLTALAAQRTAGVHPFLVTPESTAATRALLGPDPVLAPYQAVVLEQDPDAARAAARGFLGGFLGMAHYARSLRAQGFTDDDLAAGGSDRLIDAVVAWGDAEAIAKRLQAHHDAGADHVALHVLGSTEGFPRRAWRELAPLAL